MSSTSMLPADLAELKQAKALLTHPGLTAKITNLIGGPIEKGFALLPKGWHDRVSLATRDALNASLKGALYTMQPTATEAFPMWHKLAATVSGGIGGAFGLPALLVELPVSTTIIFRSIADIARAHGEDLSTPDTRLACLAVFALGGPSDQDDAADTGYFSVRAAMTRAVTEATDYLIEKSVAEESAPALVRLIGLIATRFEIQVSEKAAAMAVPVIGAVGGATINLLFMNHFQDMSRGHFCVRKLERQYGAAVVKAAYDRL